MGQVRNILFIMCDQLRWDYLSCAGHPTLETPHIDMLARRGVRFTRAYCQSPVCGPSRMSFYTGRYAFTHGSTWNNVPLDVSELTLGDYLRPLGLRVALAGKTHFAPDLEGMKRLGISAKEAHARFLMQAGFEPYAHDDGLHPGKADLTKGYNKFLIEQGYVSDNPWHDFANSADGPNGEILSGWHMRHARKPARIKAEHSETPWLTDRAMDFMGEAGAQPWCLHLSYIKPHWPYVAPDPYHALYSPNQMIPVNRHPDEKSSPHPVVAAFMKHRESVSFGEDATRDTVIPTYMGLIKQIDDELGRLFAHMEQAGLFENTMIVMTSDHGDYLGDHWLGEKELFHEESALIPMIVYDPDQAADARRGQTDDHLVEAIDLIPTFIEAAAGVPDGARLEGRSLVPLLRRAADAPAPAWRPWAISEIDYSFRAARRELGMTPVDTRAYMVRDEKWKYIHYNGMVPQLFNLDDDPRELIDLGIDAGYAKVRAELHEALFSSLSSRKARRTLAPDEIEKRTDTGDRRGVHIGQW